MASVGPVDGGLEHPLGQGASEPARARALARRLLERAAVPDRVIRVVELVASELVTNALVHGAAPRSMSLDYDGARLTVTVQDGSAAVPTLRRAAPGRGGLGLRLVEELAESWGCREVPGGKRVHAVVSMSDAARLATA
jgi:serine/threonine-protein kinase RsbW